MDNPRKFRAAERHFLNLPGFHAGAYIRAEVEDTAGRDIRFPSGTRAGWAPSPRMELEIADCDNRVRLYFDLEDAEDRMNSFHKIDTLISSLTAFRIAMIQEAALRRGRLRLIEQASSTGSSDATAEPANAGNALVVGALPAA